MEPIRIGFVGLSPNESWAARAHLPYLQNTPKYQIVALCNSSLGSAEIAIRCFGLPPSVKAYGSCVDLANDPRVDLVVCSVRVDKHNDVCRAAVEAGKDCWSEWPLGQDFAQSLELQGLAVKKGVRTVISLPGRQNSFINTIKGLVASRRVGRILSTTIVSCAGLMGTQDPLRLRFLNEREVGGNLITIVLAHCE